MGELSPSPGLSRRTLLVAVLLLSLNLTSLWRWWVKAAAIVVTISLFAVTYQGYHGLMGWPTTQKLPPRFSLVWTVISEPNKRANNPGSIYLWVDELDANNVPSGRPRSYQLAYSKGLARKISSAQEKRDHGQEVMGVATSQQVQPDAQIRRRHQDGAGPTKQGGAKCRRRHGPVHGGWEPNQFRGSTPSDSSCQRPPLTQPAGQNVSPKAC